MPSEKASDSTLEFAVELGSGSELDLALEVDEGFALEKALDSISQLEQDMAL